LTVRLLGPLEVLLDGRPVQLGGQRPRALISLLALSAGTAVSTGRLVDAIWDGDPPQAAANTVQVYVSRLRRALAGPDRSSVLQSSAAGYTLDVPEDAVDVNRFERLVAEGHARLQAGDAAGASRALRAALDLWRGPAVPDLTGLRVAEGLVARLDARRLAAQVDLVDADAALGRHAEIVPELQELVRLHPLDEGLVIRLMTALYRSGRQADALAAYAEAAGRLDDELGVEPGPQLRQIHTAVLRHEVPDTAAPAQPGAQAAAGPGRADPSPPAPALPAQPGTASSAQPGTASSAGASGPLHTSRSDGASGPDGASDDAASAAGTADGGSCEVGGDPARTPFIGLPRSRTALIGRSAELARALELLADPQIRLVTLLGPGGTGKTRLATEIAARLAQYPASQLPGGVAFVPLSGVDEPSELLAEVCRALDAAPAWAEEPLLDVAVRALGRGRTVLVLDNLEQLVDGPEALDAVAALLDRLPELTVVCTSRTVLHLRGEHRLTLDPLPLPDPDESDDVETVLRSDAVRLFRERAAAVLPDFEITRDNAHAVADICRMLDGLPLALELAAARVRLLAPDQMVTRMAKRLQLLSGGARDLPERQRSMRAALDWSAQLLDPDESRLFAQLSVFGVGWTVEAAEAVCDVGDEDVLDLLARLVDKSLVVATGSGRLTMLQTIRDYAAEQLSNGLEAGPVRDRHAHYYADLAERLGPQIRTSPDAATRSRLDAEAANFVVALEHAAGTGDGALLARLVVGLLDYWFFSGRLGQADRWVRAAQSAQMPHTVQARLLMSVGSFALIQGDLARAVPAFEGALHAARDLGDHLLTARSLAACSTAARFSGRLDAALEYLDEALASVRVGGPQALLPQLENERGEVLDGLGRPEEARPLFEAYRHHALADGDRSNLAWANVNLALQALERGEGEAARRLADSALQAADDGGAAPVRADVRTAVGLIELRLGDAPLALPLLRQALELTHSAGQLLTVADLVSLTGAAFLQVGEAPVAARLLAAGRAWRRLRGLAVVGRPAQQTIDQAEAEVGASLTPAVLARETERGSTVPYGWLSALSLPDGPVVDLRDAFAGTVAPSARNAGTVAPSAHEERA
jgi:predicted ATPase/DNA-binding SARP family transcriptional activator